MTPQALLLPRPRRPGRPPDHAAPRTQLALLALTWLTACTTPKDDVVIGEPDVLDTASPDDNPPAEPTGCIALGPARARCGLLNAADWSAATAEAVAVSDVVVLGDGLAEGTDSGGIYNGGAYFYGSLTSAILEPGLPFDGIVPSWNAETPAGTWLSIQVRARVQSEWTAWYRLGVWASGEETVTRHSFDDEGDTTGAVWTDTVFLESPADAVQIRATLFSDDGVRSPTLRRLAVALADTSAGIGTDDGGAWGTILSVPGRSQMEFAQGEAWCSPTSTSMVMSYWADQADEARYQVTVPEAAEGTWDDVYGGNGNWPFNTAFAASRGLDAEVGWFDSIDDIEPWIRLGVPVVISAAWDRGELDNAPISSTNGHLLVVTGFTTDGDVTVNDPAAERDEDVDRTYDRRQIESAWMNGSGGVVYLIWDPTP